MRDGRVWQHSIGGLEPVDVILRRVDAWFCDPLELRPDSRLGVPGLVQAARLGSVAIVNGLGTGVLENAGLFPFLPRIAEVLLSQPLRLPSAPTWWCGDELSRRHVLARLDSLVIKPISRRVARSSHFGWELSAAQRDELVRRIEAEPYAWVGQQPLALSTAPTAAGAALEPRPALLRTFAVAQDGGYTVLRGGLCRVAPDTTRRRRLEPGGRDRQGRLGARRASRRRRSTSRRTDRSGPTRCSPRSRPASPRTCSGSAATPSGPRAWPGWSAIADNRWRDSNPSADRAIGGCLAVLLGALGDLSIEPIDPNEPIEAIEPNIGATLLAYLGDEQRPGTVAHDARQLRELATAVRDQLSGDTWAVLARLERALVPFARTRSPIRPRSPAR